MNAREDKVLETVTRIDANVAHLLAANDDKEKRIRSLEKKQWAHSLGVTLVAAALAKFGLPLPGVH
jgi:hypothetical protein